MLSPITAPFNPAVLNNYQDIFGIKSIRTVPPLSYASGVNNGQAATLVCDVDAAVSCFATSAGVQANADGQYIQVLSDMSGQGTTNGNGFTQTNTTYWQYNPILQLGKKGGVQNGINGRPALIFPTGNSSMQNQTSNFCSNFSNGFTWIFVVGFGNLANSYTILGQTGFYFSQLSGAPGNKCLLLAGGTIYYSPPIAEPFAVVAVTVDIVNSTVSISINNSTLTYTYTGSALPTTGTFSIGNLNTNGQVFPGPMGRVLMYNAPLTLANTAALCASVANDYGLYLPLVGCYGDSFATGQSGATAPFFAIPQRIAETFQGITQYMVNGSQNPIGPFTDPTQNWSSYKVFSPYAGFSGYTAAQLTASAQLNTFTPFLNPYRPANIVIVLGEPTNSIAGTGGNETPAQAMADMTTLGLAIKAANPGTFVVLNTVLPRASGGGDSPNPTGTNETRRLAVNALMLAYVGSNGLLLPNYSASVVGFDAVANPAGLSQFAGPATPGGALPNGTTYQSDGVHPSNVGCELCANVAATVVRALIAANFS